MKLLSLLSERKTAILEKWFDKILETYPADSANFLKTQKNPFANPVGPTIFQGLEGLFEGILKGMDFDTAPAFLDSIIRIRAVQDFTPSQAVSFVFLLKNVIREELGEGIKEHSVYTELSDLESRIDSVALLSFDVYVKCREKIYEFKASEIQKWTFRRLQRADRLCDSSKTEHDDMKFSSIDDTMKKRGN
ncbi:MAG TPA: hypothetical protein ENG95_04555 [Nitrospirae bacterium]|nr:hypothetical protein [Nitrospirota bacterium]HDK16817.1 hypothetical protein [Nitrospirota bacterium]HDK81767.1 hypothetical protein [Nitrospirota bacterium]HDO25894.1 hypothetical protein [Nitrospirota bacterium]